MSNHEKSSLPLLRPARAAAPLRAQLLVRRLEVLLGRKRVLCDPDFSARGACTQLGVCSATLSNALRAAGRGSFPALVKGARVRMACQLLREEKYAHLSVLQVGLLVGFKSAGAFQAAFTSLMGVSPGRWRKEQCAERGGEV